MINSSRLTNNIYYTNHFNNSIQYNNNSYYNQSRRNSNNITNGNIPQTNRSVNQIKKPNQLQSSYHKNQQGYQNRMISSVSLSRTSLSNNCQSNENILARKNNNKFNMSVGMSGLNSPQASNTGYYHQNQLISKSSKLHLNSNTNHSLNSSINNINSSHSQANLSNLNNTIVSNRKLQHINMILPSISDNNSSKGALFLGDIIATVKPQIISQHKIEAVLTCLSQTQMANLFKNNLQQRIKHHHIIKATDTLNYPLQNHFEQAYSFIHQMRQKNLNILVHCHAGVSRSASLVCAYLIKSMNYTPDQAVNYIKSKRQRAKPNIHFWNQLINFYNTLNQQQILKKQKKVLKIDKQQISNHKLQEKKQQQNKSKQQQIEKGKQNQSSYNKIYNQISSNIFQKAQKFFSEFFGSNKIDQKQKQLKSNNKKRIPFNQKKQSNDQNLHSTASVIILGNEQPSSTQIKDHSLSVYNKNKVHKVGSCYKKKDNNQLNINKTEKSVKKVSWKASIID